MSETRKSLAKLFLQRTQHVTNFLSSPIRTGKRKPFLCLKSSYLTPSAVWIASPRMRGFQRARFHELSAWWFVSKYRGEPTRAGNVVFLDVRAERIHEAFGAIKITLFPGPGTQHFCSQSGFPLIESPSLLEISDFSVHSPPKQMKVSTRAGLGFLGLSCGSHST